MAYVQGFVVPVPAAKKDAYTKLAADIKSWQDSHKTATA